MAETASPKRVLLAGFYDAEKRAAQVLAILEEELKKFRAMDFTKDIPADFGQKKEERTLETIQKDITTLYKEVDEYAFTGGHFTKQYRTFQGTCDKLLQHLDSLNIDPEADKNGSAKAGRGKAIKTIQDIVAHINGKVHPDGKCCDKCELKGTMWE